MGEQYSIKVGLRAFLMAFTIILGLMVVSGVLTRVVPAGSYEHSQIDGREVVVSGSYREVTAPDYPIWRWATAPVEVLFAPGNVAVITIILFLIFVGGAFTILEQGRILQDGLQFLVARLGGRRYLLMAIIMLAFMLLAAFLGIYEALVPLIVFIVPLAHILGWDSMVGLGMSLLPLAFGFSAAVTNPFTVGVAQTIAELPLFSGAWLRAIFFVLTYTAVLLFVRRYARRIEHKPASSPVYTEDEPLRARYRTAAGLGEQEPGGHGPGAPRAEAQMPAESGDGSASAAPATPDRAPASGTLSPRMRRALIWFAASMGIAILFVLTTSRSPALSDIAFPLMALLLFVGGGGKRAPCRHAPGTDRAHLPARRGEHRAGNRADPHVHERQAHRGVRRHHGHAAAPGE